MTMTRSQHRPVSVLLGVLALCGLLLGVLISTASFTVAWSAPGSITTFASESMRVTAHFDVASVELHIADGRKVVLPQEISASGARYTDGSIVFWNKGDEVYFVLDGNEYSLRAIDPWTDPWERAKAAGMNFRAVGQEPGWFLEIRDEWFIELVLDYGQTRVTTPIGKPLVDAKTGTTTYRTESPVSPLDVTITIQDEVCYDSMSGEPFTASVIVQLGGGATYAGCGRAL